MDRSNSGVLKTRVLSFCWQHFLLLCSLYLMTLGVALCVQSRLGSSVISSVPFVLSLAGDGRRGVPAWTIGDYTIGMNFFFVFLQILILRRRFEPVQLFQLLIGFVFGWLIDLNMTLTSGLDCSELWRQGLVQFAGCTVMGIGIAFEVRCGSVTMPGEGITIAIGRVTRQPFAKVKIYVYTTLVLSAVALSYLFFNAWLWNVIGAGTLFAMFYVGLVVKFINPHIGWFDGLLKYVPGFRRYIFGLAKYIFKRQNA